MSAQQLNPKVVGGVAIAFVVVISLGVGAFMGLWAWRDTVRQHELLERAVPVEAAMESIDVAFVPGTSTGPGGGRTESRYRVDARYRYEFGGEAYVGTGVAPIRDAGEMVWARSIADLNPPGSEITAWVDPDRPDRSFFVRERDETPYWFLLIAGVGASMAPLFAASIVKGRHPVGPTLAAYAGLAIAAGAAACVGLRATHLGFALEGATLAPIGVGALALAGGAWLAWRWSGPRDGAEA